MKKGKLGNYLSIVVMIIMMIALFRIAIVSILTEDTVYSAMENRNLQEFIMPTKDTLINGEWMKEYEIYSQQQIVCREWYTGEYFSFMDLVGVKERNGFVIGKEDYVLHVNEDILWTEEQYEEKYAHWGDAFITTMERLDKVVEENNGKMIVLQIPHKNDFCAQYYPDFYENAMKANLVKDSILEKELISRNIAVVTTRDRLNEHADEYLYYKTDNHYTFRGAYYVYHELIKYINETYDSKLVYPKWEDCDYFRSNGRSVGKYLTSIGDSGKDYQDYCEYVLPKDMPEYQLYESGEPVNQSIVNSNKSDYTVFWGSGANPVVKTNREELPKVLYLGLSYTNALEVMSAYSFDEVHSIDPRIYKGNISEYIQNHDFDYVVVVRDDFYEGNAEFICTFF